MSYVIDCQPQPSLPVDGRSARFPVGRIFCVGRNYSEHVREMGGDPDREAPFFFMKPADALVENGATLPYPPRTEDLHHEIELVAAISGGGRNIAESEALAQVYGYAVGIDLTRRDLQGEAKQARRPWEAGKAFEHGAPCGTILPSPSWSGPDRGRICLSVNGEVRQDGDLGQMTWSVAEVIAQLSTLFTLKPGDLIFTGTPSGVGPVGPGDRLEGEIDGLESLSVEIGARK